MNLLQLLTALSEKEVRGTGSHGGSGTDIGYSRSVTGITQDSRCVQPGFVFVCISGYKLNGHDYIEDAIRRGAVAVVVEREYKGTGGQGNKGTGGRGERETRGYPPVWVRVKDGREALALLSAAFYQHPSRNLRVIGITGTNGKTTTSYLVASILEAAGFTVGLTNTLTCRIRRAGKPYGEETAAIRTTPESVDLQRTLRRMVDQGCHYAVVEVSSHSLVLNRVLGCEFDAGVLTNITSDHMDFHKTFAEYRQAKLRLFSGLGRGEIPPNQPLIKGDDEDCSMKKQPKAAVLNMDDPSFSVIKESTSVPVFAYGFRPGACESAKVRECESARVQECESAKVRECESARAGEWESKNASTLQHSNAPTQDEEGVCRIRADRIVPSRAGIAFEVYTRALPECMEITSPLTGLHNVSNILAAIGVGLAEGIDPAKIQEGIRKVSPVPGRFETIDCGQDFWVVVDFAHTADALQNLLQTARHLGPRRIITVFGCGGDRDQSKRFPMGQVAATLSDQLIITNDNSRSEDPASIARQIEEGVCSVAGYSRVRDAGCGMRDYEIILDRYQAIKKALSWAQAGDMVLIAGKGHEQYQVIGSQCIPFDDRQVARQILTSLTAAGFSKDADVRPVPQGEPGQPHSPRHSPESGNQSTTTHHSCESGNPGTTTLHSRESGNPDKCGAKR
jgi:UDP-N-acetylmuramoyl-L-alanyl-D-glutamate--2,6-diaminopimelate ligase